MPWESLAQEGWGHSPEGQKALGGAAKVAEWDAATKGSHLPKRVTVNKGHLSKTASYAQGGAVLGRTRDFMKESDGADQNIVPHTPYKDPDSADENYVKKGKDPAAKRTGDKALKAVKPRG